MAAALGALDAVPEGVSVETDTTLLARLVPGREVYWVGTTASMDTPPEYVVIDARSYAWGTSRSTPIRGGAPHTPATPTRPSTPSRASASHAAPRNTTGAAQPDPATRHCYRSCDYFAARRRSELRTTNTDEHAIAALASMGERSPAIASGTMSTL